MRGHVENARTVELFERGLGGLPSGKHCGLGQNRFERPRFARRPFQRGEIDSRLLKFEPNWRIATTLPCPTPGSYALSSVST